jgi:N-acetylglucosaminyldiphosphoundecaprenol N-acetyl-beta-D-mannosaminyltransferase
VNAASAGTLTDVLEHAVESQKPCIIAHHNLHSLYLYHNDPDMPRFYRTAEYVHADGMGLVVLARLVGVPLKGSERVTYVDWLPLLIERAWARKWRVFYLGSKPGIAAKAAEQLCERFTGLQIATSHGYFDIEGDENERVLQAIRTFAPDILLVGMGMPRQEKWIMNNWKSLGSVVTLPCGAAFDYIAGEVPTPPRWAGRLCLEWLFRLTSEPGRLWKRYLIEPWHILRLLCAAKAASAKHP